MGDLTHSKSLHEKLPSRESDTVYLFPDNNYPGNLDIPDLSSDELKIFEMTLPLKGFLYVQGVDSVDHRQYTPFFQEILHLPDIDSDTLHKIKMCIHRYILNRVREAHLSQEFFLAHRQDFSFENLLGDERGGQQSTDFVFHDLWARSKILEFTILRTLMAEHMTRDREKRGLGHLPVDEQLRFQTSADFFRVLMMYQHQVSAANNKLRICVAHRYTLPQSLLSLFPDQVKAVRAAQYQLIARIEKFFQQRPAVAALPQSSSILAQSRADLARFERVSGSLSDLDLTVHSDIRSISLRQLLFDSL